VKVEAWIFGSLTIFFLIVTPIYWFITADASGVPEITGTVALILTFFLVLHDLGLPSSGGAADAAEA
jgi:hypothetical protein